ncbi:uncharacterized protein LOC131944546 [Physella acuta]|uniref:uncharacterized protein LOC131944546 n=1 Tax=Physella acuta TaxID=109671 RepID=UPI0027DE649F|nr:uncharacterized protein LOC131944546 [Physella acuta]XP_059161203.1 uncharacterized protein LOC131944546 [Physella acuta]
MGVGPSLRIKEILSIQSLSDCCYPVSPYIPFPKDIWPAGDDGLVSGFHILPEKLRRGVDDGTWFWWCDAEFVPFKDNTLYATSSAYHPRPGQTWTPVPNAMNGRVLQYNLLAPDDVQCTIFSRTNSTVLPNVVPHPLGEMVAYCGTGEAVVMANNGDPVYTRSRDLANAVHVYCSVANNGISLACLKRGTLDFFLELYELDSGIQTNASMRCRQICQGFIPSRNRTDNVACKFSPNSRLLAVSGSQGILFTVRATTLAKYLTICPDLLDENLSSPLAFDFNPQFAFEVLTVATKNRFVHTLNISTAEVLSSFETDEDVDCLNYSRDGQLIAVGFHNFDIVVYDSENQNVFHSIDMSVLCQEQTQRIQRGYPTILHLSFSQNGEHLASTTCDGQLRLWRIPRVFSLQELCRDAILASTPIRKIQRLQNIPQKMINLLLYKYF